MANQFIVTVPEQDLEVAHAHGVNGITLAKFMRIELQSCGGNFLPGEWQQCVLNHVKVKPCLRNFAFDEKGIGLERKDRASLSEIVIKRPKSIACQRAWYEFAQQVVNVLNGDDTSRRETKGGKAT